MKSKQLILMLQVFMLTVVYNQKATAGSATLTNNVFNNIVVAIATIDSDEESDSIPSFIDKIKDLMNDASSALYLATDHRLSFGTITILLPANWEDWNTTQNQNVQSSNIPYNFLSFDTADIRIDIKNAAYGFMPYTQQSGFCGERGDFIHITYDFIMGKYDRLKYGSQSKLLTREWVKYYFGVFDEQGYNYDYMYPVKYFAPGATPILNLCNTTIISWSSDSCDDKSNVQGLPASCELQVNAYEDVDTSMMSLPLTPIASTFCSESNHNSYAPNKQNIMCDGKSVMEIVFQNSQVENSKFSKWVDADITIKQLTFDNVLAMAIFWDNMEFETSTYSALPSLSKFIEYDLPSKACISLQESVKENLTQPWTQIDSIDDRTVVLYTIANVTTEVNDTFLIDAFDNLLSSAINMTDNVKVLLFVSASDISSEDWAHMCETAVENNFQIRLITYSASSAANFMSNDNCTGKAMLIQVPGCPHDKCTEEVKKCCIYLQERKLFDEFIRAIPNEVAPNLYGPPETFYEKWLFESISDSFYTSLNSETGANSLTNRFYFETCQNVNLSAYCQPQCKIEYYTPASETMSCRSDNNAAQTYCADQVLCEYCSPMQFSCEYDYWSLSPLPYIVYVVGQPNSSISDPYMQSVNLFSWTHVNYKSSYVKVRIFARLVIGTTPIFDANVQATILSLTDSVTITLRDDGSGNPDVSKKDGVYSAYFTQLTNCTVYTVTVTANGQTNEQFVLSSYPSKTYPWISDTIVTGPFTRVVSAGSFYIDPLKSENRAVPPGRILDLQVSYSTSHEVGLQWTTPGADLDYGTIDGYYLKCSTFNDSDFYPKNSLFHSSTQSAGSISQHTISGDVDDETHYCAIITCDSDHNCAERSNIVTYSLVWPSSRHYNIVLWTSLAIVIVILLALGITVIVLYRRNATDYARSALRETTSATRHTRVSITSSNVNSIPMECPPIELHDMTNSQIENQNSFLDLPPSYDDAVKNPPPTIADQSTDISDN